MKVTINNNNKQSNDSFGAQEAISKRRDIRDNNTASDNLDSNNIEVILLKLSADDLQETEEMEEIEEEPSTSLNTISKAIEILSKKSKYPWRSHFFNKVSLASL